jgi:predicted N-acetyltransferase YhbS
MSQPVIEITIHDRLPEPLHGAARTLSRASFAVPNRTPEQYAEHRDRFCNMGDSIKWIVAVLGDDVVGLTIAYRRFVNVQGQRLTLGGIGDVCVEPAYRRQGIASRLVQAAMRELELAGCDVAYLCALLEQPGLTELYGLAGFRRLHQGHTYRGASGRRYVDHDGMIAPVRSRELFEAVLQQSEPFDIGRGNW